jgi:serine/threonine protein kinase/predicted Zn-dependent protease
MSDRWEYVRSLFLTALEYTPAERESWLDRLAEEEPDIAGEITRLLHAYEKANDFLKQPCTFPADLLDNLEPEPYRFSPGDILCERFRIVHLIGKGGMGEVYKAWDQESEEYVALKTIRLGISTHEVLSSRFRKESKWGRKVTHPNVCRIHDSFRHPVGGGEFISIVSMELLQGQTLAEHLKEKGRLSAEEALPLVRQIISGLSAIHAARILHRDLKPANLVLVADVASAATIGGSPGEITEKKNGRGFQIKITDFGIAGQIPDALSPALPSEASKFLGTPDYMAPEQLEHGKASMQSDIYALGLILYQMVTGEKPFAGASWKRVTSDPPSPRKAAPGLPENWDKTILCCLERNPKHRFQNAQTVLASLEGTGTHALIPPKPLSLRLKRAARSSIGLLAIFFLLSVSFAMGIYRYFHQRPEIPPGTMVLVTDIETPDPSLSGITVALKGQLEQSAHFEVESPDKIASVLKQMKRDPEKPMDVRTVREVALRSGASLMVSGSIVKSGQEYGLFIKVEYPLTLLFSRLSFAKTFAVQNKDDLLGTGVQLASNWIRELAGEQVSDIRLTDNSVEYTTTASFLALQQYGEAEKKYANGDIEAAIAYLKAAIKADHNFAKAHMRLADILIGQRQYNAGYTEWKIAFDLVQNLTTPETLRIQGLYYADTGDHSRALEKFQDYKTLFPKDYLAWFYWGSALEDRELLTPAIKAFQTASDLRPQSYAPRAHLAFLYLLLGQFDEAKSEAQHVEKLGSWEWARWLKGEAEFLQGHYQAGLNIIETLARSPSAEWQSKSFRYRAKFLAEMGRFSEASSVLEQGVAFDQSQGRTPDEAEKLLHFSYLAWLQHDFFTVRQKALQAAGIDNSPAHLCDAGTLLARSGYVEEAQSILQQLPPLNIPRVVFARLRLSGEIKMAQGRGKGGIEDLLQAQKASRPRDQQEYLAYAYAALGDETNAARKYEDLVRNKGRIWLEVDSPFPGLWSNAAIAYLNSPSGVQDTKKCALSKELFSIRAAAEPGARFAVDGIKARFSSVCRN